VYNLVGKELNQFSFCIYENHLERFNKPVNFAGINKTIKIIYAISSYLYS